MKVKFVSDFHTEFWDFNKFERLMEKYFPTHEDDSKTILCCAGDMGLLSYYASSYKPLFRILSKRFKKVIIVPGNHSWYNSAGIWDNEKDFWKDKKIPKNVHYIDNDYIIVNDVCFIGSCLWTDFKNRDPISMFDAKRGMSDFNCIKKRNYEITSTYGTVINSSRLDPEDTVLRFEKSYSFIKSAILKAREFQLKPVIITHHAPSYLSIDPEFKNSSLNPAYATELIDLFNYEPTIWCHGHMHRNKDYTLINTKVICNPLGYHATDINPKFNSNLVIDI